MCRIINQLGQTNISTFTQNGPFHRLLITVAFWNLQFDVHESLCNWMVLLIHSKVILIHSKFDILYQIEPILYIA